MRFPILLAALALPMPLPIIAPPARAAEDTQLWVSEALTFKADDNDSVTLDFSQRARSDGGSGGEQALNRVTWDHRVAPGVQIGGGFAYLKSEVDQEMRFHQQLTVSQGIFQSRTRLEQRFFDNADEPGWRLRERVQATVPLDADKRWALVGATELFFHLNRAKPSDRTGLAVMRLQGGLRHSLSKSVDVQLLYMRQQTFRDNEPDSFNHVPWLSLNWRI
jgi:hypothetical protein